MMYNLYLFDHNILHICFWTLPMIILGVLMIIMAVVHKRNQNKREKDFNEQLEDKIKALKSENPETDIAAVAES